MNNLEHRTRARWQLARGLLLTLGLGACGSSGGTNPEGSASGAGGVNTGGVSTGGAGSGGAGATLGGTTTFGATNSGGKAGSAGSGGAGTGGTASTSGGAGASSGATTGGAGTGAGTAGASGSGGTGGGPCQKGKVKANDVVLVGDSYFEIPNQEVNAELSRLARAAGTIGMNEMYRDRAISGTRLSGGANPIPMQYANAQAASPIKVLIMDGGGNDILQANCGSSCCASCPGVKAAVDAAKTLVQKVATDGTVEQIIFFYYPYFPSFPALDAPNMDYQRPLMKSICDESTVPCHFMDLRPVWEGHPEYTGNDNLHPSVTGARVLAGEIWAVMQDNCIAQ